MSAGGFTEDDQLRIAEEVAGRVGAKRVGLGFSGGGRVTETPKASTQGSAWFELAQPATTKQQQSFLGDGNQDTTEGAFPWDGGQRGKAGSAGRKKDEAVGNAPARAADKNDRPTVREFPMIRDRDIERSEARRDGKRGRRSRSKSRGRGNSRSRSRDRNMEKKSRRGRSKSRSRSRSRNRRKSRSRSRSRDRYRDSRRESRAEAESGRDRCRERERQRERERERERRGRERERERERERGRGTESRRSRDQSPEKDRHKQQKGGRSRSPDRANRNRSGMADAVNSRPRQRRNMEPGRTPADRALPEEQKSSLPTAAQAKAAMKRQLRQLVAGDATLKTGAKATVGGVANWERPEMSAASDFFKSDEVAAKGGVASVAPEYEARLAKILAVEDEDTICLADRMEKTQAVAGAGITGSMNFDPSTKMHHDAIFAPTGLAVPQPAAVCAAPAPVPASVVAGVMGAAARARLVLTGKGGEEPTTPNSPPTKTRTKTKAKKTENLSQPRKDEGEQPLFKSLRTGESVEARYTEDDKWYKAVILQVIHGGFEIARYKVRYSEYGNEETISWKRIRRLESAEAVVAQEGQTTVEPTVAAPVETLLTIEREAAPPTDGESQPFAGMRPRSLCVKDSPRQGAEEKQDSSTPAENADVINPVVRSATPGRKMSWKQKLQARKAGASESAGADGVRILPKKHISLVPDFLGQRKEQEGEKMLDKSEWRSKVVFGMGGAKNTSR